MCVRVGVGGRVHERFQDIYLTVILTFIVEHYLSYIPERDIAVTKPFTFPQKLRHLFINREVENCSAVV